MPSTISEVLGSLLCFRRKPGIILGTPVSYDLESKQAQVSSRSVDSIDQTPPPLTEKDNDELFVSEGIRPQADKSRAPETRQQSDQPPQQKATRSQRALAVVEKCRYEVLETYPFPTLAHGGEIVIRTHAVGLNPIDWKSVEYGFCLPEFPWVTGREMAGVVEQVGSEVRGFYVGQKVWASTYYKDCRAGCFQEFVTVPQHTVSPIPEGTSFEEASCLGVAGLTAAMTLWRWLEVPGSPTGPEATSYSHMVPSSEGEYLLIWGGSTITAQFAIQLAVLGGLTVIAVTSTKTKALAETLGAKHVVSRDGKTGDEIVAEIRSICGDDDITRAIDLVGPETADYCLKALSRTQRALFAPLAMMKAPTEEHPVPENTSIKTVEMKQFVLDSSSRVYSQALNRLVEQRMLVLPRIEVLDGGLDVIQEGLERIKRGDMAGRKVVVRMGGP